MAEPPHLIGPGEPGAAYLVHPREICKFGIVAGAATVAPIQSHPSGIPTRSMEDVDLTGRLVQAGELAGVEAIDHVVLAVSGEWVSQ